jgi:hypothetical protein
MTHPQGMASKHPCWALVSDDTFDLHPAGDSTNHPWLPFSFLFSTGEHLKVTTRLLASIRSSPVPGFLPRCFPLSLTQNFPKQLIRTSSPPSRLFLIISKVVSTALADAVLDRSSRPRTDLVMVSLVRVMKADFLYWSWMRPGVGTGSWRNMHEVLGFSQPVRCIIWIYMKKSVT